MASTSAFQAEDTGSIPVTRSIRLRSAQVPNFAEIGAEAKLKTDVGVVNRRLTETDNQTKINICISHMYWNRTRGIIGILV